MKKGEGHVRVLAISSNRRRVGNVVGNSLFIVFLVTLFCTVFYEAMGSHIQFLLRQRNDRPGRQF